MLRILPLIFLVSACAPRDRSEVKSYRPLHDWLNRWLDTRHCILANADDSLTAVTIATLTGRDCSRFLHQLEVQMPTNDQDVDTAWGHVIEQLKSVLETESLSARARGLDEVDNSARTLGLAVGRWMPPPVRGASLPLLSAEPMFGGVPVIEPHFNAGFPYALQPSPVDSNAMARAVDRQGNRLLYRQPVEGSTRSFPFAQIQDRSHTLVVWTRSAAPFAYAIDVTPTGGATHTTYVAGKLRDHAQDPRTGEIVMRVDQGNRYFIHRLRPGMTSPSIGPGTNLGEHKYTKQCLNDGELWQLANDIVVHVTEHNHYPKLLGEISKEMTIDCRGETALVLRHDPDVVERCNDEAGCEQVFAAPTGAEGVAGFLSDGRWSYAVAAHGVVALWVEGDVKPRLYRLRDLELAAITVEADASMLVLRDRGQFWSVALPQLNPMTARTQSATQP